jgi:SecD/SecF fusion protein
MNAKNLALKFGFLAVLVALCLWSIHAKGCRQGIDLQGGHSLIFEIRSEKAEIDRLQETQGRLTEELGKAPADRKKDLESRIERIKGEIENLRGRREGGNLADDMIRILKERIDPQGLRNLEWRPIGADRIEVRMPAGQEGTRKLRDAYQQAMDRLEAGNVSDRVRNRLLVAEAGKRTEILASVNPVQKHALAELATAYDKEQAARKAVEAAKSDANQLAKAEAQRDNAAAEYRAKLEQVRDLRIRVDRLRNVLANYRTPEEEAKLKPRERDELRARVQEDLPALLETYTKREQELRQEIAKGEAGDQRKALEAELAGVEKTRKERQGQIDAVVEAHKAWSNVRATLDDPSDLQRLVAKAGVLEFRIVAGHNGAEIDPAAEQSYREMVKKEGPDEVLRRGGPYAWFPIRQSERKSFAGNIMEEYAGKWYVLLSNQPGYTMLHGAGENWSLRDSRRTTDEMGRLAVGFGFDEGGAKRFYNLTSTHKGKSMAILLDNEVFSAPNIHSAISSNGIIQGRFTGAEVDEMVRLLEAGSLPARLNPNPVSVTSFGPQLGKENRDNGLRAALYSMIAVAAFMLVYYLLAGAIADFALVLNIIILLGAMSLLEATFTMAGIAGVALTIGMAVDANVLIYERLREEQAKGLPLKTALKNAYERAFSAIFDSNITTLITAAILGWVGTLEVRGFAITLGLGIAISMFTALVVTRWIFQFMLSRNLAVKPMKMLQVFPVPNIDWMAKRHYFYVFSGILIVMGLASIAWQGGNIMGIEFSAGTQATVQFRQDALIGKDGKLPDDENVRELFKDTAGRLEKEAAARGNRELVGSFKELGTSAMVVVRLDDKKVRRFLDLADRDKDGKVTIEEATGAKLRPAYVEKLFARLDRNGDRTLSADELKDLPWQSYEISTVETHLDRIQEVAREAFGKALALRTKEDFEPVANQAVPELGLVTDGEGKARVETVETSPYREKLEEFVGGVAVVVRNVNPPMTETELADRIAEVRSGQGQLRDTHVIGLGPETPDGFRSLAVLVKMDTPAGRWNEASRGEVKTVGEAMSREQTMMAMSFDAALAGRAAERALIAIVLSWIAMIIYLWVRFGTAQWGLAAVICLIHDVLIALGMVAVSGWLYDTFIGRALGISWFRVDMTMVAALLTVVGYSVNDTIVIFDRIRENRGKLTTVNSLIINRSVNQTLSRTILSNGTCLATVLIMYIWGGEGIKGFNFALLIGVGIGTYSTIAIASPLLLGFKKAMIDRVAGQQPVAV